MCATFKADIGASSGDLKIPVQPEARKGAILNAIIKIGKFHGVMQPT